MIVTGRRRRSSLTLSAQHTVSRQPVAATGLAPSPTAALKEIVGGADAGIGTPINQWEITLNFGFVTYLFEKQWPY